MPKRRSPSLLGYITMDAADNIKEVKVAWHEEGTHQPQMVICQSKPFSGGRATSFLNKP